jgi:hypothetical protein
MKRLSTLGRTKLLSHRSPFLDDLAKLAIDQRGR